MNKDLFVLFAMNTKLNTRTEHEYEYEYESFNTVLSIEIP